MNTAGNIPFLDLVGLHAGIKDELTAVFADVVETASFIGGPIVQRFENDFAEYCATTECVGVGSGTDALRFALMAAGVGRGDVVVTVPNTFIATTEAISQAGARPVFVDIDEQTYNMDSRRLQEYLEDACQIDPASGRLLDKKSGARVAAIVPVHLYGMTADMDPILELAEHYHLPVIEDACQAHGAEYFSRRENRWMRAGSMGLAAAFSFYPGKNLGACGEAGAVTTSDPDVAKRIRLLRDHGQAQKYFHDVEGYNGRLDALQAGILSVKLARLSDWNEQRRQAASCYRELFAAANEDTRLPYQPAWAKPVYHLFVVRVQDRAGLQKHLADAKIGTGIHYPIPLHLQKAYSDLGYAEGCFPVCERLAPEILSLPMYPGLQAKQQSAVVEHVLEFLLCSKQ